jgi:hypothetical protein
MLGNRVNNFSNVCGIVIDASAVALPTPTGSLQPFTNSIMYSQNARPVYATAAAVQLQEVGSERRSGVSYKHTLRLTFPGSDPLRANRVQQFINTKYIYIKLSDGMTICFGRNDYFQNSRPKIAINIQDNRNQVTFETESITPLGFTNGSTPFDFPLELPVNLYNL